MKPCPTSNMNRSRFWGFEVSHIVTAFFMLAGSNVALNVLGGPLIFSWAVGTVTLALLRIISHRQKNGHLELQARFLTTPHLYLGHQERKENRL